ncbi:MAG: sigma-70 family RNA polymerase sigma factor [Pirellulales bacterium]
MWIRDTLPDAVAYAASLMGDRGMGEDVVQDCICRLLDHADRYDLPKDGRKLLFRSITNACINQKTRSRETLSLSDMQFNNGEQREVPDPNSVQPVDRLILHELHEYVNAGLQTLPIRQRSALELASLGYKPREIAEVMVMQPEQIRVLLFRARDSMAKFLNARLPLGLGRK